MKRAGADRLHVDIFDGRFVPSFRFDPALVTVARRAAGDDLLLDVHLMIKEPHQCLDEFAAAGAGVLVAGAAIFGSPDYQATIARLKAAGN